MRMEKWLPTAIVVASKPKQLMTVDRPTPHRASIKDEQGADTEYKDSANGQTIYRIQALNEEVSCSITIMLFIS